ncbi:MAG: hypothetical protein U1E89_07135 [Burkholderiaceae bacterium]
MAPSAPTLHLRLLGPMAVLRAGVPIELPRSRKARALLALLALAPRPQPREQLCEMLWDRPSDPRAALRGALTQLRAVLDEPGRRRVMADAQGVQLDLCDARVDVHDLEATVRGDAAQVAPADWAEATAVEAEFLQGLEIDRAAAWAHWLLAQRRRFRGLQVALLERMADQLLPQSDDAMECLNRWLRLLPHDRRAHERLLDALARRGLLREGDAHLAAAVRQFESEGQDAAGLVKAWRDARERHGGALSNAPRAEPLLVRADLAPILFR